MIETIQNHLQSYIINSEVTETDSIILNHIASSSLVSPTMGLNIYYNAYRLRLIEILSNDFSKLKKSVEEKEFEAMAIAFIENSPSKFVSVRYFGGSFAYFLNNHPEYRKKPYLSEMAAFEWALGDALDAADSPLETLESLKAIPAPQWSNLQVFFHPSFQMIKLHWNVPQIWQSIENEQENVPKYREASEPVQWLIVRSNFQSAFRSAEANESYALELAQNGKTFGEICEKLCDKMTEDQVPYFALSCLQKWIQEGLIANFSY